MLQSFIAGKWIKPGKDGASVRRTKSETSSVGSFQHGKRRISLVDVVVDVAQVLGHLGVDARLVRLSAAAAAPVAHDAHLHEAAVAVAQQGTPVVPLGWGGAQTTRQHRPVSSMEEERLPSVVGRVSRSADQP